MLRILGRQNAGFAAVPLPFCFAPAATYLVIIGIPKLYIAVYSVEWPVLAPVSSDTAVAHITPCHLDLKNAMHVRHRYEGRCLYNTAHRERLSSSASLANTGDASHAAVNLCNVDEFISVRTNTAAVQRLTLLSRPCRMTSVFLNLVQRGASGPHKYGAAARLALT